ncbi:MAG TPA: VC0807 family protein [Mycobacteriales bacterium]|nr:VC0807 family protein [Mycobacteriales bacterium]
MIAASALDTICPAPTRAHPVPAPGPQVRTVVRRIAKTLSVATLIPTALFYVGLVTLNLWVALSVALGWCYAATAWKLHTKQQSSTLLWLTVVGLTGKTIVAFVTGSTLIYFLQPALADAVVAAAFLLSLFTARPAVARIAAEFYPMNSDIAARVGVQKLFVRLTALWALICATRAGVTIWLLHALSMHGFVAAKTVYGPTSVVLGAALTVVLAVRVARREGLLPGAPLGAVAIGGAA